MPAEFVNLTVGDGTQMRTYVARPENPRAAIIVFQEIFGINSHIRNITERFAAEGYLAVAPELFHRSGPGWESGYTDMEPAFGHMKAVNDAGLEADIHAAYNWIQANGKGLAVTATGFCMGGRVATLTATMLPLACGISFYGGGIAPNQFSPGIMSRLKDLKAPMLFHWGDQDHMIPPSAVESINAELRAHTKSFICTQYSDANHGFFCDQRESYHAPSAAVAWPMTLAFLAEKTKKAASA